MMMCYLVGHGKGEGMERGEKAIMGNRVGDVILEMISGVHGHLYEWIKKREVHRLIMNGNWHEEKRRWLERMKRLGMKDRENLKKKMSSSREGKQRDFQGQPREEN